MGTCLNFATKLIWGHANRFAKMRHTLTPTKQGANMWSFVNSSSDASAWMRAPIDLSKVDEVVFADLIPGSGHGAGGYVNVASFEVYGKPVKRH